jgi:hypothetical protein
MIFIIAEKLTIGFTDGVDLFYGCPPYYNLSQTASNIHFPHEVVYVTIPNFLLLVHKNLIGKS